MNERRFNALLQELIDENAFAIRAVLKILDVQFTDSVPTLAVTRQSKPRMLVNLQFLSDHCQDDYKVKAVIIHEFLHVLLGHTEGTKPMTPARHLALDAVINAIIHRQYGCEYSSMMSTYYADVTDLSKLLRPMTTKEEDYFDCYYYEYYHRHECPLPQWVTAWAALYAGKLVADDIEGLVLQLESEASTGGLSLGPFKLETESGVEVGDLLGNHQDLGGPLPDDLENALNKAMKEMNGSGIWRSPKSRGVGANPYEEIFNGKDESLLRWERKTLAILKQHLQPDRHSRATHKVPVDYRLPVLSPGDRRAFIRSLWAPFLPEAQWNTTRTVPAGTAQVYLDVSGSMNAEMPLIVSLLGRLSRYIRRPFWAFSDIVAPAVIENGQLRAETSGGTSMSCVLEHLALTRPASAIVVTDGYIENVDQRLIQGISATRFHAIVTRDGNPSALHRAGISYSQLDEVPS